MRIITHCDDESLADSAMLYAHRSIQHWLLKEPVWSDGAIIRFSHHETASKDVLTSTTRTKTGYSIRVWGEAAKQPTKNPWPHSQGFS
jgi:hypothetical protein